MDEIKIRGIAGDTEYHAAEELCRKAKVSQVECVYDSDSKVYIQGAARDEFGSNVVNLIYDVEQEVVVRSACTCTGKRGEYLVLCRHCVAVLMSVDEKALKEEVSGYRMMDQALEYLVRGRKPSRPKKKQKRQTTEAVKALMEQKSQQKVLPIVQNDYYGKMQLEPQILWDYEGAYVRFRVGADKLYVLKDVISFADAVEDGKNVKYGKKLEFVHTMEMFAPESRPMVQFIINWVIQNRESFRDRYSYYYVSYQKVRNIYFNRAVLDDFLDAAMECGVTTEKISSRIYPRVVRNTDIPGCVRVIGTGGGARVQMEAPMMWDGNRYFNYILEKEILRVPVETVGNARDFLLCLYAQQNQEVYIQKEDLPMFCQDFLPALREAVECKTAEFDESEYVLEQVSFEIYLDMPQEDWISAEVYGVYGKEKYSVYDLDKEFGKRDVAAEMKMGKAVGAYFTAYDAAEKTMYISEDEEKIYELLVEGIPWMQTVAEVYISDKLKKLSVESSPRVTVGVSVSEGGMELEMLSEDMSNEQLFEILSRYSPKKKYYRLKNGNFVNMEGDGIRRLAQMKDQMNLTNAQLKKGHMQLPKYRAIYLDSQFQDSDEISLDRSRTFKALVRNMKTVEDNDFEVPVSLKKTLRSYQRRGFRWIKTLQSNGFAGILADDMGLGKTLQVIAFLLSVQEENALDGKKAGDSCMALIVTPASLVYNWQSEVERFAPQLSVKVVAGNQAQREEILAETRPEDILVTSYDLLKRDIERYGDFSFGTQVIDEAQYIKNQNTQAARAVKQIQAGFRLALTGTPIENRLSELWSIFDYLMPGFLYSYKRFKEKIEIPVVQNQDENAMLQLQKMVHPFILRRLKKDVLRDLPDKLEEDVFARIEGEQQSLYDAHVKRMKIFLEQQSDQEFKQAKIQVLAELTRLRQICCDPSLIYEDYDKGSAKLDMCMELVENAINGGHKVLLFSQFTTMLERIQSKFDESGIRYHTLTGATDKIRRRRMVEQFNSDDTQVFCISLKAGGTGLNLTAADIVIHYDPWWNEAVQNQATDRAHRIGQKKVVTVYRLLTKGTVEEKIMKIQEKKKALSDKVLSGEGLGSSDFSREELLELLS